MGNWTVNTIKRLLIALVVACLGAVQLASQTPVVRTTTISPVTSSPNSPFSVSAGVIASILGSSANEIRLPNGSNAEYGGVSWSTNVFQYGATINSGTARNVRLYAPAGANLLLSQGGVDYWQVSNAGVGTFSAVNAGAPVAASAPTDSTVVQVGDLNRLRSSSTITPATAGVANCGAAFLAAALTADCTIATLPAGMKLVGVYADVTAGFTCSGTCTGTKVVQCGTAVNGTQVLAASLNVATTATYGLADADLGSGMTRAAAIQGGLIGSWSATTPISCRFTSGTGNWGNAATTFVNAGSIKFTLITEQVR